MNSTKFLLLIFGLICFSESRRHYHHGKRHHHGKEKELQRAKRNLYDIEHTRKVIRIAVSPIKHSKRNKRSSYRPYVPGQVQDVQIQIKLKMYWKDELANKYTPQFRLLAGNVIDEVSNALIDNRNFVEAAVLKFRPSKWNILVDLSVRFFKTEVDPLHYLEGIVASGWVSGLQVFSNYFKVIKIVNGNVNFPVWNYPKGLRLRLLPAMLTKVNAVKKVKHKVDLPANYKEIRISFQLYQKWNILFLAKFSAPYRLLSGNIEESLDRAFAGSPNYIDSQVLSFRESTEGQCIVDMYVRFSSKEVYPAQKLKILISSGNIVDTPVISDSLEIYEINNITSDQPIQEPVTHEEYPKPHSDADVNQGNETETETGTGTAMKNPPVQLQETSKPIYPLNNVQALNKTTTTVAPASSDEASMYLKLQRMKFMKQSGVVIMERQSSNSPEKSKENALKETSEPIYPKQSEIAASASAPQQQQKYQQQQTQQQQTQQQQTAKHEQQQQQQLDYQYIQPSQVAPQAINSLPDRNLWQSLPEQVEGKLVMNTEKPVSQTVQQDMWKGDEKQLAPPPVKTKTDLELQKLQQDIKEQNSSNSVTGNIENSSQVQEDNLAYSSDTPTLTKTLYPQIAYSNNQSNDNATGIEGTAIKANDRGRYRNVTENFPTEKQDYQSTTANASTTDAGAAAKEQNEDHNTIATIVAGVLSEQVKHIKAVKVQTSYTFPLSNNSVSANNASSEGNKEGKLKQVQGEIGAIGSVQDNSYNLQNSTANYAQNISEIPSNNARPIEQGQMGSVPAIAATNKQGNRNVTDTGSFYTGAYQKVKQQGFGTANWNTDLSGTQQPNTNRISSLPLSSQQPAPSVDYTQTQAQPQQQDQQTVSQPKQPITSPQQPITYQQQQQPITQQNQPITSPQQQQLQGPAAYQQPNSYAQMQQQQQPQKQPQQQPQQQQQQQQQQEVAATSNEVKPAQTAFPIYSARPASGYQTSEASQSISSSPKTTTQFIPYQIYTYAPINSNSSTATENTSYTVKNNTSSQPAVPLALATVKPNSQEVASNEYKTNFTENSQQQSTYTPKAYDVTTKIPAQGEAKPQSSKPHVYTPKVKLYQWPPVAMPLANTNPPPQYISEPNEQIVISEKELTATTTYHSLHGKMTLQQTWHPLLGDKNSLPYKVLTEHIQHSIEETYLSHHIHVSCKVKELRKSHRSSNRSISTEKVGVDFDLTFASNEGEVVQTMNQVAKNGVISELLVFPDSVSVDDDNTPNTIAPANPTQQSDSATASSSVQTVVATSPIPLNNAMEVLPENNTKALNYNSSFTSAPMKTTSPPEPSFEFVTAPKDIPKSCEEIRDFGIGNADGQYVLEARKGCHLSVICQNMEDKHPKEFLGGPNRVEWEKYPFAALIKISAHDKENIQSGACLENSEEGKKLLEQITKAKGRQQLPTPPWQTNIKRLLEGRKRRAIKKKIVVILEGDADEASTRIQRSTDSDDADWGVL